MAVLFAEHFDGYADIAQLRTALGATTSLTQYSSSGGRFGGGALRANTFAAGEQFPLWASPGANAVRAAFWIKTGNNMSTASNRYFFGLISATRFFRMLFSTRNAGESEMNPSKFDDTASATLLDSVHRILNDGEWHHIEIYLTASTTVGNFRIWIDGEEDLAATVTSGDTSDAASGDVTAFTDVVIAGCNSNASGQDDLYIDDVIVWDDTGSDFTGYLGVHRLRKIEATADGATEDWTLSTGSDSYALLDDDPINTTDYISSLTAGHITYINRASLGITPNAIKGVLVESLGLVDSGTHSWRNKLDTGTVVSNGASQVATASYVKQADFYGLNPEDTAAWAKADVEASEWGVEYVS